MRQHPRRARLRLLIGATAGALALTGCSAGSLTGGDSDSESTLTFLVDNGAGDMALANGLADAFEAANDGVSVKVESRPQGAEGDNVVKTRLSTGDMTDVFMYNTGSLLRAIDPGRNLVPMDGGVDGVEDDFVRTVEVDGKHYGTPFGTALAGGVLYNRAVYDRLDLEVPRTWEQFMSNNATLEEDGIAPVIQTYQDTWTSQLLVLGDFHNVATTDPDWPDKYTGNQVKYAQAPAIEGFEHLQAVHDAGYMNEDYRSANLPDGLAMLAEGKGAHYPILTTVLGDLAKAHPEKVDDIGFFGLPGDDPAEHGMTVWPGLAGVYIPTSTQGEKLKLAKKFQAFVASAPACEAQSEALPPTGPYLVEACDLPSDVPPAVTDLQRYFDEDRLTPALEFLSPVKGPALEQICVQVGSGITSAEKGAQLYDEDVKKQARQLNLPGWS